MIVDARSDTEKAGVTFIPSSTTPLTEQSEQEPETPDRRVGTPSEDSITLSDFSTNFGRYAPAGTWPKEKFRQGLGSKTMA
jgi:hypothetical protein